MLRRGLRSLRRPPNPRAIMQNYPAPARELVAELTRAAAEAPERAVAFQGAPGCNSHIAAMDGRPDCLPLPCFSFEDALDAVRDLQRADQALIPIENSLHGRVADIHFLLPESGLSIVGEHFMPIRYC
jgi:prephenate dehydratase